jgi:hypothetical protein
MNLTWLRKCCALSGFFFVAVISANTAWAQKEPKTYYFDPAYIGQGQSMPYVIASDRFSGVESIRFDPAAGITIGEIKEIAAMEAARCWTADVSVAKDATVGKRAVLIQTPEGVVRKVLNVVSQRVPIISNFEIVKAEVGYGWTHIEFTFQLEHEPGVLAQKQVLNIGVTRPGWKLLPGFDYYSIKTTKIDPIDETHSLVRAKYSPSGQAIGAYWILRVALIDKYKHWSNEVETKVTFQ